MVVGEPKRTNIMDGIENTGDVRLHDHRLRLKQRFDIVRKLGQGTYGKVQLGINKKTGQEVAIKTIKKCKIESEADLIRIRREVQIMSSVRHPNIVHIYEVFENSEKMILVMEYCSGGELYDYLSQKKVLEEEEARRLFRQIATAVYYCHIHKICHRDLKLENVLLDDTGSAKIADFGLSNVFKETSLLSTFCGSPLYASPEIVKGTPYIGPEVDCWSLGVLLYTLVYGAMPFDGSNFKRLVRQISNGDYYEPKSPSTASPLIRDMLTVDPLKRADITYICDHPWVNCGCDTSCLEMAEALAAETPVRLDLLLSLAPAAPSNSNSVMVPPETELGPEESCTDLTSSTSMAVEPSNSAEKRILELVAEGGEDAIKPSPTRTIVSAGENKRKLELAMSASGLQRKKEKVASSVSVGQLPPPLPEEGPPESPSADEQPTDEIMTQPCLKSSATITIAPAPVELVKEATVDLTKDVAKDEDINDEQKPRVTVKKKVRPTQVEEKQMSDKQEETQVEEVMPATVALATDRMTSLSLQQPTPPAAPTPNKPKKLSIPGGHVGSFKEQFERRASLTTAPEIKRNVSKPVVSKIAKPKAQSEEREMPAKTPDNGTVRLQQIGIEPSQTPIEDMREINRTGVKKTESEPMHNTSQVDPSVLLQDARRSLQNSMAKLVEEKAGEESRRRAARDIISSAIRTGKPPVPYGRSSSAGVTSLSTPPATPPAAPPSAPPIAPRLYRTEAQHRVEDHRNRGVSVERIIPIHMAAEDAVTSPPTPPTHKVVSPTTPAGASRPHTPLRRLPSTESPGSEVSSPGEPIKKSAREFIIPIAVEGKGYVTPRQRSLEPETAHPRITRATKPRRICSLVSGGESEEEDDTHMHRLRSSRAARAESVSSGEEDEEDEGFHLLTAENLFSTLLHRVRALTQRLNGEEGPGFSQHPHSLFNNLNSPFFNSPHLPRRHLFTHKYVESKRSVSETREGWGSRDMRADFDSMFNKSRTTMPRGSSKKSGKHQTTKAQQTETKECGLDLSDLDLSSIEFSDAEMRALSGLTPALSRRLQRQLLAHLPPAAARTLRRTLSLHAPATAAAPATHHRFLRSQSAGKSNGSDAAHNEADVITDPVKNLETEDGEITTLPKVTVDSESNAHPRFLRGRSQSKSNEDCATDNPHESLDTDRTTETTTENIPKEHVTQTNLDIPDSFSVISRDKNGDTSDRVPHTSDFPQFCTLPRFKQNLTVSRHATSPTCASVEFGYDNAPKIPVAKEGHSKGSSIRNTPDRPLLSKYLTSERHLSLDESYSSDSGSIISDPSYIAAYGSPCLSNSSGLAFRRHFLRLTGDQPRRRISRFLRSDFFDAPPDESIYAKHKKEKELETQKILKEIREKKNKSSDSPKSLIDTNTSQTTNKDETTRKCLSPIGNVTGKDRGRSTTPFFPILDNIKETNLDTSLTVNDFSKCNEINNSKTTSRNDGERTNNTETKMTRPKSYPVKNLNTFEETNKLVTVDKNLEKNRENEDRKLTRESKLIRPKSYPNSSPSPEKNYINRNSNKVETKNPSISKEEISNTDNKNDVEVSFRITLPKKKAIVKPKVDLKHAESEQNNDSKAESTLVLKKYEIIKDNTRFEKEAENSVSSKIVSVVNDVTNEIKTDDSNKTDDMKKTENESNDKKGLIKKKIIRKVSSKSKSDLGNSQDKDNINNSSSDKKKVPKKAKEKNSDDGLKSAPVMKKKSVLQSIGHKLERFASSKSSSPEKSSHNSSTHNDTKKDTNKSIRMQREQSVPVTIDASTESNLIKRAVTLTDVAALENQTATQNKTTVSKVLGLFKKFEPKEKNAKLVVEKSQSVNLEINKITKTDTTDEPAIENDKEKIKRPTSLLLNGLGRKNKYVRGASDSVSINELETEEQATKENEAKNNIRNTLKLDFSRLPRVKKIVPTNPVIEPKVMNVSTTDNRTEKKDILENNGYIPNTNTKVDTLDTQSRSRSRSRSTFSNSDIKSEHSLDFKVADKVFESLAHKPHRNNESISPDKEDIVDRIRRKSFYSRFNEKKQRRKSSLVGPGAIEYDPVARLHSQPTESKLDVSPTSSSNYDLSPGFSNASDLSPATDRYRSLLNDLPSTRSNLRYDGLNDKIDTYRSLDRNEFRKLPNNRSYLDYDPPLTYGTHRYSRTKSLLDSSDGAEDHGFSQLRDSHKYNRTNSLFTPGNYATYRPKRIRNSAIMLKESDKEPSPENIYEKIKIERFLSA